MNAIQPIAVSLRRSSSPLLEEEGDVVLSATGQDFFDPVLVNRPESRTAFSTHDDPMNIRQVDGRHGLQQRLEGDEADRGVGLLEMAHAGQRLLVFDRDAKPDVPGDFPVRKAGVDVIPHE